MVGETSGAKGGRPGKHYMLNFRQLVFIALRTETDAGRKFSVVIVNAYPEDVNPAAWVALKPLCESNRADYSAQLKWLKANMNSSVAMFATQVKSASGTEQARPVTYLRTDAVSKFALAQVAEI